MGKIEQEKMQFLRFLKSLKREDATITLKSSFDNIAGLALSYCQNRTKTTTHTWMDIHIEFTDFRKVIYQKVEELSVV